MARVITCDCDLPHCRLCVRSLPTRLYTTLPGCHNYIPATTLSCRTRVGELSRFISLTSRLPRLLQLPKTIFSQEKKYVSYTLHPCPGALRCILDSAVFPNQLQQVGAVIASRHFQSWDAGLTGQPKTQQLKHYPTRAHQGRDD